MSGLGCRRTKPLHPCHLRGCSPHFGLRVSVFGLRDFERANIAHMTAKSRFWPWLSGANPRFFKVCRRLRACKLPSELRTNNPVKAIFWPWPEPNLRIPSCLHSHPRNRFRPQGCSSGFRFECGSLIPGFDFGSPFPGLGFRISASEFGFRPRKTRSTQNYQLNLLISNSKQKVDILWGSSLSKTD